MNPKRLMKIILIYLQVLLLKMKEQINIAKTSDEKLQLVSAQNVAIAEMINLLHKNTMT